MVVRSSSQNCANCGWKVQKSLATRTDVCHHCGFVEYRDINASINILTLGLSGVGHTGTYATGDLPSWAIGVNLSSNGESGRIPASLDRGVSKIILAKYALDRLKMKIMDNWFLKFASGILKRITVPEVERIFPLLGSLCQDKITS